MKIRLSILFIIFFSFYSCDFHNAKYYLDKGLDNLDKKEYGLAIKNYTLAIEKDPENYFAYHNRNVAYQYLGEFDLAIKDLTSLIKINPEDTIAYHERAMLYYQKQEYKLAVIDFNSAIKINPQKLESYSYRAICNTFLRNFDAAIGDADILVSKYKSSNEYNNRGACYVSFGKNKLAIEDLNIAIKLDPKFANTYANRGIAYKNLGDRKSAIADFNKAATLGDSCGVKNLKEYYNIDFLPKKK